MNIIQVIRKLTNFSVICSQEQFIFVIKSDVEFLIYYA